MTNQKILAFAGAKQSGKTTCLNFMHGYQLVRHGVITDFAISPEGVLFVEAVEDGVEGGGELDISRTDEEYIGYARANIWPFVKCYNFADPLKYICTNLFGLEWTQCFGTDKQKNTKTPIKWDVVSKLTNTSPDKDESMTAREFLQFFGTNVCRAIKPDIWTNSCIQRIKEEQSELSIVGDCRFPNEVESIQKSGGRVIRLTRRIFEDLHESETALDKENYDWDNFDLVIDNANMTLQETHDFLLKSIQKWGW